jgi:sterol desaturase/sphingolipid hydroxylase (fatty acid hydroxylase superfamily)
VVLVDVGVYWVHRAMHQIPFLWRFHSIHHSTRSLDWVSGFRNHPGEAALAVPVFLPLLAAGLDPAAVGGVYVVVTGVVGAWAHLNVRWRMRPLHKLVLTPDFHHWHHANEPEAINTNYSVFLPLWDILFGTYFMPADRRPQVYGTDDPVPGGVLGQLAYPLRKRRAPVLVPF